MKIGIDARMLGPTVGGGGLGRYVEELVTQIAQQDQQNRHVLFLKFPGQRTPQPDDTAHMEEVYTHTHWYTLKEQLHLPRIIERQKLDLIHFPHWNVPLWIKTPFVVTIHDLILLEEPHSAKITTRHPLIFWIKRLGYRVVLWNAIVRSKAIIAVSEYTKSSILRFFPRVDSNKIHVVHEGLTDLTNKEDGTITPPPSPYFLYVGNAYPHKNLEALLHAFSFFHKAYPDVTLVLAGRDDVFYQRLKKELEEIDVHPDAVKFILGPSDNDLATLYRNATLYLFPSRSEGFGLPPLEAMSFGVPVAAAKRSSLPEILGDAALWFEPDDIESMVSIMEQAINDPALREELAQKGAEQIKRYTWADMASTILKIYQSCA